MTPAVRLELIRARLNRPKPAIAAPVGAFRAAHPEAPAVKRKKPYIPGPEAPRYSFSVYGDAVASHNRKEWVQKPDKKAVKVLAPKRVKRVSALTRISQQLPMKLPVLVSPFSKFEEG